MRQEGQTEGQIITSLQNEGISPKEIREALSQSQIKNAVRAEQNAETQQNPEQYGDPNQQMQPSVMSPQPPSPEVSEEPQYQPQLEQAPEPSQDYAQSYPQDQSQYQDQGQYQNQGQYQEYYGGDLETMNEIAQQIVEERIQEILKQTKTFTEFKENILLENNKMNARLEKIEGTINELQMSIIGKIGEYGENINNISKEMQTTQDSFSKILDPLTDNIREMQKLTGKEIKKPKAKTKGKKSDSDFEDYLR